MCRDSCCDGQEEGGSEEGNILLNRLFLKTSEGDEQHTVILAAEICRWKEGHAL